MHLNEQKVFPMAITIAQSGGVLELTIVNPPVNALGLAVRTGLLAALADAADDDAISAVVIRGNGRCFSAGADISEFDSAPALPLLPAVIAAVEAFPKPVVAALHGQVLGGGLELALACHYRVATASARLGLPEVQLGLLPGAGGTQRLPRIIGVAEALAMIVTGKPIGGTKALEIGLVDLLAGEAELAASALAFAAQQTAPRRSSELTISADAPVFETFAVDNKRLLAGMDAPQACVEAIRAAAELPFAEGLAVEERLFESLLKGSQSRGLRHAFFAERAAAKVKGLPEGMAARPIAKVGIIGAGTMGGGIAMNFLSAGIPVVILDRETAALERGVGTIRKNYAASAAKGRIAQSDVDRLMGLLTPSLDYADLGTCDLLIEAVFEDMAVKLATMQSMDAAAKPGAILASNTSFLDLNRLAQATSRPQDVVGLHFFSPANIMKLLEVVRGEQTAIDVLATAMGLARKIGKVAVVAGVCHGFIGNRILLMRQKQAERLLLDGASPQQVDKVHLDIGMPMGPFQMTDLAGMDIGWHRDSARIDTIRDAFCSAGRFGQKSGAGFYDYDERRKASRSDVADRMIADFRTAQAVPVRDISDEEIRTRTLYVMVNEAAKVLEEGIAQRASDIDVVWLYGYGWPRVTGGLVNWANETGLENIVAGLKLYAEQLGEDGVLSPLLLNCAKRGLPLEQQHGR